MNEKHSLTISSYSDLDKIERNVTRIHFRKFLSKKMLLKVLGKCKRLSTITISKYAYSKCKKESIQLIKNKGIDIIIRNRCGRPSLIERLIR